MNILVIGNGFDLAHELPTSYVHFLNFIKVMKQIMSNIDYDPCAIFNDVDFDLINKNLENYIKNQEIRLIFECKNEFLDYSENNVWIEYFIKKLDKLGENWIDFESGLILKVKFLMLLKY